MASYRYERDIDPKDLKPRKQRQYSRKERWANWWDYNLKWVLIFGIAGAFVAYCFIGQYFLTTHPDYNIAVVSPYYLPEATVTALQQQLAAYGEDCNDDGKVVVKLNQYTMAFNSEDSDAYLDMAGTTKLSTDIQSSLSSIFILTTPLASSRPPARCGIWTVICPSPTPTATGGTWSTAGRIARC